MFCPVCWKEYPKGMRHCDSCRADLIDENPAGKPGHEGHEHEKPAEKGPSPEGEKKPK